MVTRSEATAATAGPELPGRRVTEREAWSASGVLVLVAGIGMLLAGAALVVLGIAQGAGAGPTALILAGVLVVVAGELAVHGLTSVVAGEARAVQLFGRYRGTIRDPGLHWVNPFARRRKVSTRIRNQEPAQAKVNDADGNPIEIAALVVWQVQDTASALYSVDDFTEFVTIQTETRPAHRLQLPLRQPGQRRAVAARQRRRDHSAALR